MALTISITRGITLVEGTPYDIDDLNQLGLPTITITGSVGSSDLAAESVNTTHVVPGDYFYAAGSLSGGVYAFTLSPAPSSHAEGLLVAFKADSQNAGAVDINPNSLGAKDLLKLGTEELQAGDIRAGQIVIARYDGTAYQMLNPTGQPVHRMAVSAGTEPNYTAGFDPAVTSLNELTWRPIRLKIHASNSGAATLNVDGLGAKAIVKRANLALDAGDLQADQVIELIWEPTLNKFVLTSPVARPPSVAIVGQTRNLILQNNGGAPNTQVDVDADAMVLAHIVDTKEYINAQSVNLTADLTTAGANGRGTSTTRSANTWYYIWVIGDKDLNIASLISDQSSVGSLDIPSGYAYAAMVGVMRTDGSQNFVVHYQQDRRIYRNEIVIFDSKSAAASDTYESYSAGAGGSDVDLTTVVPPLTKRMGGNFGSSGNTAANISVAADANELGRNQYAAEDEDTGGGAAPQCAAPYAVPLKTAQTFWWKSVDTSNRNRLTVSWFDI